MTTKAVARVRRRLLVRLSVLAVSSVALTASWLGVVWADQVAGVGAVPAAAQAVLAPRPNSDSGLVPAPPATRRVVVVRQSRAS